MPIRATTSSVPPSPVGDDETARWLKYIHEQVTHRLQLIDAPGIRFERTTRGIKPIIGVGSGGGGGDSIPPSGGMEYLGEWSAGRSYDAQKMVTRGALGEFICVQPISGANIGTEPETGAPYWKGLTSPPPGVWA